MTGSPHYGAMFTRIRILLALAVVGAVAAAAGTALAAEQGTDSQVTISPRTVVASAGQTSPVDVGGVPAVRAGKPIPSGYVLVGRPSSSPAAPRSATAPS